MATQEQTIAARAADKVCGFFGDKPLFAIFVSREVLARAQQLSVAGIGIGTWFVLDILRAAQVTTSTVVAATNPESFIDIELQVRNQNHGVTP